jgi:hypothetical protein
MLGDMTTRRDLLVETDFLGGGGVGLAASFYLCLAPTSYIFRSYAKNSSRSYRLVVACGRTQTAPRPLPCLHPASNATSTHSACLAARGSQSVASWTGGTSAQGRQQGPTPLLRSFGRHTLKP